MKDCGNYGYSNSRKTAQRIYESKYKNVVVEWEGSVLRVDGDHQDDDTDSVLQINAEKKHYISHQSAEIMVRMNPGEFANRVVVLIFCLLHVVTMLR